MALASKEKNKSLANFFEKRSRYALCSRTKKKHLLIVTRYVFVQKPEISRGALRYVRRHLVSTVFTSGFHTKYTSFQRHVLSPQRFSSNRLAVVRNFLVLHTALERYRYSSWRFELARIFG